MDDWLNVADVDLDVMFDWVVDVVCVMLFLCCAVL